MIAEIEKCPNCGAPIARASLARCEYCHAVLRRVGGAQGPSPFEAVPAPSTGQRLTAAEIDRRGWRDDARLVWSVGATASSEYSSSWGAAKVVGPPRVFPRYGDIAGAWASRSPAGRQGEWLEVHFPEAALATGVLVFETYNPGGLCAITDVTDGVNEPLWRGDYAPVATEPRVLEVRFDAPRLVRALRLVVRQDVIGSWSEIDAVAIIASQPMPALHEAAWARYGKTATRRRWNRLWTIGTAAVVAAIAIADVMSNAHARSSRAASTIPTTTATAQGVRPPAVSTTVPGARASRWRPDTAALAGAASWATAVDDFSSAYGPEESGPSQALGKPDTYAQYGDLPTAWASLGADDGYEWITVRFRAPSLARAVVVVETFNPGAVIRVDDMTDAARPVALWSGREPQITPVSSVLRVDLPAPRPIGRIRVVLDTRLAADWNEVDAIGLVP